MIEVYCCFCDKNVGQEIDIPGFDALNDSFCGENWFCEEHAKILEFLHEQCSGCVGMWGDCSMWRSIGYPEETLTQSEINTIRSGYCPKRTNGTLRLLANGTLERIDLSTQAPEDASNFLADSIVRFYEKQGWSVK